MSEFDDAFNAQSPAIDEFFGEPGNYQVVRNGRAMGQPVPFTVSAGVAPQIRTASDYGTQIGTYADIKVPVTVAAAPVKGDQINIFSGQRAGQYVVEVIKSFAGNQWVLDCKNVAITSQGAKNVREKRG